MGRKQYTASHSYLYCERCGNQQLLLRNSARRRKQRHAKHLYCYKCRERTKHIESNAEWDKVL